jgi:hypothetical protein
MICSDAKVTQFCPTFIILGAVLYESPFLLYQIILLMMLAIGHWLLAVGYWLGAVGPNKGFLFSIAHYFFVDG